MSVDFLPLPLSPLQGEPLQGESLQGEPLSPASGGIFNMKWRGGRGFKIIPVA